ncbi:MAG: hypothetical protein ACRENO_05315 [Thermodesulfobacteriota bacterium]
MKFKHKTLAIKRWTLVALLATVLFSACKKDLETTENETAKEQTLTQRMENAAKPAKKVNPFSHENIKKAKRKLTGQNTTTNANSKTEEQRLYTYIKFDPNEVSEELMGILEADSTIHMMDFPFANGEYNTDEFALDENKAAQLRDGMLYAVIPNVSPTKNSLLSKTEVNPVVLDELYLPDEEDTTLIFQALREINYTEEQIAQLRICLFKRPTGFVRYWDDRFQRMEPVRGTQVWGLVFGIPIHTYTDANGYYRLPWRFSAGTIMGTHAKNPRVNIKPLNTNGSLIQVIPQLIINFIFGSVHVHGWYSSCRMRDDINFEYNGHTQPRYWSQLLNAYFFHDQYANADNVENAPNAMTVYAQWANNGRFDEAGVPDFGNASTPMLNKNWSASLIIQVIARLLDFLPPVAFLRLVNAVPPDMTFRVPANTQPQFYCERLAQTAFHELGHAMHYRRAGNNYWYDYIAATLNATPVAGNPYGDGQGVDDGNVAVGESWAEFLGTNYAIRRYGNAANKARTSLFLWQGNFLTEYQPNPFLQENERWFWGGQWIPSGFYNDLMDGANVDEAFDNVQGVSIRQLWLPLGPDTDFMCDYLWTFMQQNPGINQNDVIQIAMEHNFNCF